MHLTDKVELTGQIHGVLASIKIFIMKSFYKVENTHWNLYREYPAHAVYGGRSTLNNNFFVRVHSGHIPLTENFEFHVFFPLQVSKF